MVAFLIWYNFYMENKEFKIEELWDWISSEIGFDQKGLEIQDAIREFVKLKMEK